jgi:PPP family 3-phenylpropionic acid transporter
MGPTTLSALPFKHFKSNLVEIFLPIPYHDRMNANGAQGVKTTIAIQYFLYFGVMGIFLPYFNLYCYDIGFSAFQIGTLSAARSVVMIIFPLIWATLADRYQKRRAIYILSTFASAGLWSFFLVSTDFWPMLAIMLAYGIFYAPIIPFLEAFSMDSLGRDKPSYGRMRAWGSIAFIVMVLFMGRLIDRYSIRIILWLILTGSLLQAAFSARIPSPGGTVNPLIGFAAGARKLCTPKMALFMGCAFLMLVSHGAYYGFFSIHLTQLGFGHTFIGLCWAVASCAEILVMIFSARLFARFDLKSVLFFSMLAAALRWFILSRVHGGLAIVLTQLSHALTYGTFHMASILVTDALAPVEVKTLAQAVNNALTYGLGLMVGFLISGSLYQKMGAQALFTASGAIALVAALVFQGAKIHRPNTQ